jgi:hypothetical protein
MLGWNLGHGPVGGSSATHWARVDWRLRRSWRGQRVLSKLWVGHTVIGVIQLALCLAGILSCGITTIAAVIWGLIEGILILAGTGITKDAKGVPLT